MATVLEQMQMIIQNITYSDAIVYYTQLKKQFLQMYSSAAQVEARWAEETYLQQSIKEINQYPIKGQEDIMHKLLQELQMAITETLNGRMNSLDNFTQTNNKKKMTKKQQAIAALRTEKDNLLDEQYLQEWVKQRLIALGYDEGFTITDILNQVRSYRERILARSNASSKYYIQSGKGFVREAMIHQIMSKITNQINPALKTFAGNIQTKGSGKNKVQSIYDIVITPLEQLNQKCNYIVVEDLGDAFMGMQVKSWNAPWEAETSYFNRRLGYSIGSRQELLNSLPNKDKFSGRYAIIQSIRFLRDKAKDVLGAQQVAYITGQNFIWTADLIANFRKENYFLAFGLNKDKKLTANVRWFNPQLSSLMSE